MTNSHTPNAREQEIWNRFDSFTPEEREQALDTQFQIWYHEGFSSCSVDFRLNGHEYEYFYNTGDPGNPDSYQDPYPPKETFDVEYHCWGDWPHPTTFSMAIYRRDDILFLEPEGGPGAYIRYDDYCREARLVEMPEELQ